MLDLNKLDSRSISIKGLGSDITEEKLWERFINYGPIKDVSIVRLLKPESGAVAYIKFENELSPREATLKEVSEE